MAEGLEERKAEKLDNEAAEAQNEKEAAAPRQRRRVRRNDAPAAEAAEAPEAAAPAEAE